MCHRVNRRKLRWNLQDLQLAAGLQNGVVEGLDLVSFQIPEWGRGEREVIDAYTHTHTREVRVRVRVEVHRLTASPGPACVDRSCDGEAAAVRCPPWT